MTLKELVDNQKYTGASDIDIIKAWFISNNKESEGISLITELSESKLNKLENTLTYARMWIPTVPDVYEANIKSKHPVPKDVADKLNHIIQRHLLGMPLTEKIVKWAKETIPTMKTPTIIFVPAVEWLRDEYGIEFADKKINNIAAKTCL